MDVNLLDENLKLKKVGEQMLDLGGEAELHDVVRIPIKYLHYNKLNTRIMTLTNTYKHNGKSDELTDDVIEDYIYNDKKEKNNETIENIRKSRQKVDAVVLSNGIVADGNRRLTCLRKLFRDTGNDRFAYLNASILNEANYDDEEIKLLEIKIQNEEERVPYDPIDRLQGVYEWVMSDEGRKIDPRLYARDANQSYKSLKKDMKSVNMMLEFLKFINQPYDFEFAKKINLNSTIGDLHSLMNSKNLDDIKKETIKEFDFCGILCGKSFLEMRTPIKYLKKNDFFTQEKVDDLREINQEVHESFVSQNNISDELKKKVLDLCEDIVSEYKLGVAKTKDIALLNKALEDLEKIDMDRVNNSEEDLKSEFKDKLSDLNDLVNNLLGQADVSQE